MRTALRGRRKRRVWVDELTRRLRLADDQWHDGLLAGLSIQTDRGGTRPTVEVTLRIDVYGDLELARRRKPLTVTFAGVRDVVASVNGRELADSGDDHIVFARLNEASEMVDLSIHLAGGHIRIVAERFAVAIRLDRRGRARD